MAAGFPVHMAYYPEGDTLVIRLSEKPIAKEVSQSWHVHISFGADGEVVEVVILEAKGQGMFPANEHRDVA